jgi:hypothetical protein
MDDEPKSFYVFFTTTSTGSPFTKEEGEIIERSFGKFRVKIKLDEQGRFVDILEIKEDRDFRSLKQVLASKNYFDVEKYAADEPED